MKKLFVFFIAISMMALFFGCKNESADNVQPVNVPMEQKIQSDRTTEVDYSGMLFGIFSCQEYSLDAFLDYLTSDLFDDPDWWDFEDEDMPSLVGVRILVKADEIWTISYGEESSVGKFLETRSKNYPESEGWKSYGKCSFFGIKSCVAKTLEKAALDLAEQLEDGMCIELAVEVTVKGAEVFGRIKKC